MAVQIHETNDVYFRYVFHQEYPRINHTYIATLVIIDVQNSQPPCGISSPTLGSSECWLYWMHIDRNCIDFFCNFDSLKCKYI